MRGLSRQGRGAFQRLLAPKEQLLFASRQHWLVLWKPTLYAVAGLLFLTISALNLDARPSSKSGATLLLWLAVAIGIWWVFHFWTWRRQWFGVTNRRLIFLQGLVDTEVRMMPLNALTDMTYRRTWVGDTLGYAHFIVESAGQNQALERLRFIPDAEEAREQITRFLFGAFPTITKPFEPDPPSSSGGSGGSSGGPPGGGGPREGGPDDGPRSPGAPGTASAPWQNVLADRLAQEQPDVPRAGAAPNRGPSGVSDPLDDKYTGAWTVYQSADRRRRRRAADTGPIPIGERPQSSR